MIVVLVGVGVLALAMIVLLIAVATRGERRARADGAMVAFDGSASISSEAACHVSHVHVDCGGHH